MRTPRRVRRTPSARTTTRRNHLGSTTPIRCSVFTDSGLPQPPQLRRTRHAVSPSPVATSRPIDAIHGGLFHRNSESYRCRFESTCPQGRSRRTSLWPDGRILVVGRVSPHGPPGYRYCGTNLPATIRSPRSRTRRDSSWNVIQKREHR